MEPVIRLASYRDFPTLLEFGKKFYSVTAYSKYLDIDEASLIDTYGQLAIAGLLWVVEVENETLAGMAAAFVAPLYWDHSQFQGIEAFWWIEPEWRRSGLGDKLRQALQNAAKLKGASFWHMVALKDSMPETIDAIYRKEGLAPLETVYMKVL